MYPSKTASPSWIPLIESWDIDLATFSMEIVLSRRLLPGRATRFEFVESEPALPEEEPGLTKFLQHLSVNGDATKEEIEFLKKLRVKGKHPTPLYYYRELQNLRDPVHFRELTTQPTTKKTLGQAQPEGSVAPMHKYLEADGIERQLQLNSRKKAMQQWAGNRGKQGKKQKQNHEKASPPGPERLSRRSSVGIQQAYNGRPPFSRIVANDPTSKSRLYNSP